MQFLHNRGARHEFDRGESPTKKAAEGLQFRRRENRYVQTISEVKPEQPLKARSILYDEFFNLDVAASKTVTSFDAYGSQGRGVNFERSESGAAVDEQALKNRAPRNEAVQRAVREGDFLKREVLKQREVKRSSDVIGEAGLS